jgi:hypothetical protein
MGDCQDCVLLTIRAEVAEARVRELESSYLGLPSLGRPGRKPKHGYSRTMGYVRWASMRARCNNSKTLNRYGGRGIRVCDRWASYENFLADMGVPDAGMQLDRIDNDGDYEPGNCRWVTAKENARNRGGRSKPCMITCGGRTQRIQDWANETGINVGTLHARIFRLGWDLDRALGSIPR